MYFDGNITFKGTTSGSLGVIVSSMPKMQHSTVKATEYDIPLRDGIQYSSWRNRTDAQITVKFAIVKDSNTAYIQTLRATRQWLEGTGQLKLGNNPDVYYNVKKVEITDETMYTLSTGELEATFTVEPFEYLSTDTVIDEEIATSASKTITVSNDGDLCKPLVIITPYMPQLNLLGTNKVKIQVDSGTEVYYQYFSTSDVSHRVVCYSDSNLMFTYSESEGSTYPTENYITSHNYDDLWVPHGTHDIKITNSGSNYSTKVKILLRKGYAI